MTDRYNTLTVALEKDIRDDDAEELINAIKCLRFVLDVSGNVASHDSWVAESRAKTDLGIRVAEAVHEAIYGKRDDG